MYAKYSPPQCHTQKNTTYIIWQPLQPKKKGR